MLSIFQKYRYIDVDIDVSPNTKTISVDKHVKTCIRAGFYVKNRPLSVSVLFQIILLVCLKKGGGNSLKKKKKKKKNLKSVTSYRSRLNSTYANEEEFYE